MNVFKFAMLFSVILWSLIFDLRLIYINIAIILLYHLISKIILKSKKIKNKQNYNFYSEKGDCAIFTKLEINIEKTDKFLEKYNKENPKNKLSYTLIGAKSLGEGFKKGLNKKISFGNLKKVESANLSILVNVNKKNLVPFLIKNCEKESLKSLRKQIKGKISKIKQKKDKKINEQMELMKILPSSIIQISFRLYTFISYTLGLNLPIANIKKHHFGTAYVSNVSSFGIKDAFSPLNIVDNNIVMIICAPYYKVLSEKGKLKIGKILNLNITFDARYSSNGSDFLEVIKEIQYVWENPEKFV